MKLSFLRDYLGGKECLSALRQQIDEPLMVDEGEKTDYFFLHFQGTQY